MCFPFIMTRMVLITLVFGGDMTENKNEKEGEKVM